MEIISVNTNSIKLSINDKIIELKGHIENDGFQVFSESLETYPSISPDEIETIKERLPHHMNCYFD